MPFLGQRHLGAGGGTQAEGGVLLGLLPRDERLHGRVAFDDARQERAFVHLATQLYKWEAFGRR